MRIVITFLAVGFLLAGCGPGSSDKSKDVRRGGRPHLAKVEIAEVARVKMTRARCAVMAGTSVFVCQVLDGMTLVDLADPTKARVTRRFAPEEIQPLDAVLDGNLLFMADRFRGLVIWDVSKADNPTSLSALALPGIATGVTLSQTSDGQRLAAMACGGAGLQMVDVTTVTAPRLLGGFTRGIDYARKAGFFDGSVFLSDNADGGMKLLDITNPAKPTLIAQWNHPGFCEMVRCDGANMETAWRTGGVALYDRAGKGGWGQQSIYPVERRVTAVRSRSYAHDVLVLKPTAPKVGNRNLMAVADGGAGVAVYNISNSGMPVLVGEAQPGGDATGLTQYGDFLLASCWDAGLVVLSIK